MKNVFDPEDTYDYDNGIAPMDERHMKCLVENLAQRLASAKATHAAGAISSDVCVNYEILDLAVEMMGSFTRELCRNKEELLGLIGLVVADYDDVVGDFVMEMKPKAFGKYCQRRGIFFKEMEPQTQQDGQDDEDVADRNRPVKFFLLAKLFHVDTHCRSEMKAWLKICRESNGNVFGDYEKYPYLSQDSDF